MVKLSDSLVEGLRTVADGRFLPHHNTVRALVRRELVTVITGAYVLTNAGREILGLPVAECGHPWHNGPDNLPVCRGEECDGWNVACGRGLVRCERHGDRDGLSVEDAAPVEEQTTEAQPVAEAEVFEALQLLAAIDPSEALYRAEEELSHAEFIRYVEWLMPSPAPQEAGNGQEEAQGYDVTWGFGGPDATVHVDTEEGAQSVADTVRAWGPVVGRPGTLPWQQEAARGHCGARLVEDQPGFPSGPVGRPFGEIVGDPVPAGRWSNPYAWPR